MGMGETYLGSDALALAPLTQRISYLEEGDWVVITRDGAQIFDKDNNPVEREITTSGATRGADREGQLPPLHAEGDLRAADRGGADPAQSYVRQLERQVALPQMDFDLSAIDRVTIVACGTSYYAGMVAKYWFEQFARVPVDIDVASEFRYRDPGAGAGRTGAVHLADRAKRRTRWRRCAIARPAGQMIAVVVNVPTSSMAREADLLLPTHAGPEIGVASTKAFTCQLAVLAALAAHLAVAKGRMDRAEEAASGAAICSKRPPASTPRWRMTRRSRPWRISSRRRATCSIWAAGRIIRWRWKAR